MRSPFFDKNVRKTDFVHMVDLIGIEPTTLRMRTVRSRKVVSFLPTDCGVWSAKWDICAASRQGRSVRWLRLLWRHIGRPHPESAGWPRGFLLRTGAQISAHRHLQIWCPWLLFRKEGRWQWERTGQHQCHAPCSMGKYLLHSCAPPWSRYPERQKQE